jgi:REP element-mobilizing transposase RayT
LFQGPLLLLLRAYRQDMPRLPRNVLPEYATFHATARGVAHMPIYDDDSDRRWFPTLMSKAVEDFDWQVHAFCLMTNHYHLVVEGLRDNLSDGMKLLNGEYAQLFNGRYKRWGHVFGDPLLVQSGRRGTPGEHVPLRHGEPGSSRALQGAFRLALERLPVRPRLEHDLDQHEEKEQDADHAVHREERSVEPP